MEDISINTGISIAESNSPGKAAVIREVNGKNANVNAQTERSKEEETENRKIPVRQMVSMVNNFVQSVSTKIQFQFDPESEQSIIIVTEKDTGKLIRQIPSEEMLELIKKMEEISGIIFHRRA